MSGPRTPPPLECWPTTVGDERLANATKKFYSNQNAIEILTTSTADDVFNTFLLDRPYPEAVLSAARWFGFIWTKRGSGDQLRIWKEELEYILHNSPGGVQGPLDPTFVDGKWDVNTAYIWQNICGPLPSRVASLCR